MTGAANTSAVPETPDQRVRRLYEAELLKRGGRMRPQNYKLHDVIFAAIKAAEAEAEARGYEEACVTTADMARCSPHLVHSLFVVAIEGLPVTRDANREARSLSDTEKGAGL